MRRLPRRTTVSGHAGAAVAMVGPSTRLTVGASAGRAISARGVLSCRELTDPARLEQNRDG